jgi:RNA polymerase sigma-70 factor (ECF subfamily)
LRFWESLNSSTEIEDNRAFIYQIARNLVIDHYRQKNRTQLVSVDNLSLKDPDTDLEKEARLVSELSQIQKAIGNLKNDYQDVIIWYYLDEIPVKEIARMLNKSENAIRLTIHRALKSLREFLKE